MTLVGRVDSLWRYPVKSMRGEQLEEAYVGFAGISGDRIYAFHSSAAPVGFPYLTGREQARMLLYRPVYRLGQNLDVTTPAGDVIAIDDQRLIGQLQDGISERHELSLLQSDRAMTDCRPVSIFSKQTARQLSEELGFDVDKRRFRANVYIDLESRTGFGEDEFVGRTLRIGETASVAVVERDLRCKMITLDPDTAEPSPEVIKHVTRSHDGKAGVYANVLVEGTIRVGDPIFLIS